MNHTQLRERDDLSRCSMPLCRDASQIIYHPGATPANPRKTLSLCDEHHEEFCQLPESKHDRGKTVESPDYGDDACDCCTTYQGAQA